jgi:TPP-dependent pyruvate/acetoin dehydrogenase alpha subunit
MLRIRRFEESVLSEFSKGRFLGTTHTYIGQEANAVGVISNIHQDDLIISNHRSHGHFLAYGGDMRGLFAELMGKPTGICGGRGGSQHLHWRNFYSNGVLGGTAPIAVGMALAEKFRKSNSVAIVFIGDGTLGEGVLYESMNLASLWSAPILYVLENNRIAQTTPIELNLAGDILKRFSAFGINAHQLETSDVEIIYKQAEKSIDEVRGNTAAQALILNTHRFGPHSKGDDTRPETEMSEIRMKWDPIKILSERLDPDGRVNIDQQVNQEVSASLQQAVEDPVYELSK